LPEPVVELTIPPPGASWAQGYYAMTSYGGNAGTRSTPPGAPPAFPGISRDGMFFIDSCVRMAGITDGTSHTLLFGERFHRDPKFDRLSIEINPQFGKDPFIERRGMWGIATGPGSMTHVTLHAAAPINYQLQPGADASALSNRVCAFGSGHSGG